MTRGERRNLCVGLAFVSPWIIGFILFTLYPVLASFYYSFCDYDVLSKAVWIGSLNSWVQTCYLRSDSGIKSMQDARDRKIKMAGTGARSASTQRTMILNAAIGHLEASRGRAVFISSIVIDDAPPRHQQASYVVSKVALETLIEAWQAEHHQVGFTSIACGDALTEFGDGHDVQKLAPIVQKWQEHGYMYGRAMDVSAVAEQVVHALASSDTIRRIAITPSYA